MDTLHVLCPFSYVPCWSEGEETVYKQHTRRLRKNGILDCPRQVLLRDLKQQLLTWRQAGDRLVVFIDTNEDTTSGPFHAMLTGDGLHMRDAVFKRHTDPRWCTTAMFKSGDRIGRHPIDGCFVTPDLPTEAATWLAFARCPGNHRFCILDFKTDILVGDNILHVVRPAAGRLSCAIPDSVKQYNQRLAGFMASHQLLPSLHQLYSTQTGDFTPAQSQLLQGLDMLCSQGMRYAEKKCHKFAMGKVEYSPVVAATRLCRWLWQKIIHRKQGRQVSNSLLRRTAKKCGVPNALCVSLAEAQHQFDFCDQEYATLKRRAPELQSEFLRSRASNATGNVTPTSQKAAQRQLKHERQRNEARHLRQVLGNARGGAISRIEVAQGDVILEVSDQHDVECYTMEMCEARFRLTENTPPMTEPLRSDLGFLGTTAAAQQILAGTYVPGPDVDDQTRQFFLELQASAPLDPVNCISCTITRWDFQQHWRRSRERTSSLVSGLHYGHYKAAAQCEFLSEVHALMTELAVTGRTPLLRWESGLSVMLEKTKGVIQVDKLRAILLMEADFNFYNGLMFAKWMIECAEQNSWIPPEIYGGRKNHEAIDVAMNRRLVADIARQRRAPLAIASVDAQTCYDRMAHSVASIAMQGWQVDQRAITAMLFPIQRMKYFLRTLLAIRLHILAASESCHFKGGAKATRALQPCGLL